MWMDVDGCGWKDDLIMPHRSIMMVLVVLVMMMMMMLMVAIPGFARSM
jgi:hypothetical protein